MSVFTYYQLVSLDGENTPIRFYRRAVGVQDVWNPHTLTWVHTDNLDHMLIRGEVNLDYIDYDPTARL